jgi:peptide-methionine (R)-S-oxide reductase
MKQIPQTEEEWKKKLTAEEYEVMRGGATELPYTGEYLTCHKQGTYHCKGCDTPLFSSKTKYDFNSGWASFSAPCDKGLFEHKKDTSFGDERTSVYCAKCKSHIGHIFEEGPEIKANHTRYSVNSCSVVLKK